MSANMMGKRIFEIKIQAYCLYLKKSDVSHNFLIRSHMCSRAKYTYMLLINVQCISGISNGFDLMEYN